MYGAFVRSVINAAFSINLKKNTMLISYSLASRRHRHVGASEHPLQASYSINLHTTSTFSYTVHEKSQSTMPIIV